MSYADRVINEPIEVNNNRVQAVRDLLDANRVEFNLTTSQGIIEENCPHVVCDHISSQRLVFSNDASRGISFNLWNGRGTSRLSVDQVLQILPYFFRLLIATPSLPLFLMLTGYSDCNKARKAFISFSGVRAHIANYLGTSFINDMANIPENPGPTEEIIDD